MSGDPRAAAPRERAALGAAAYAAAFFMLTVGDGLAKATMQTTPVAQAIALRTWVLLILLSPLFIAARRRGEPVLAVTRPGLVGLRVVCNLTSSLCGFAAIQHLPLATQAAIFALSPMMIALIAIPALGERLRPAQIIAIGLGFAGCLIILRPSGDAEMLYAALSVASAVAWSGSVVLLRLLTRTESAYPLMAWSNIGIAVVVGVMALFDWRAVDGWILLMAVAMGVTQVVGQWLSLIAFRVARAATVAPMQYTQLLWATIIGVIFFQDWPAATVWIGAGFIVAGGLWLLRGDRSADAPA